MALPNAYEEFAQHARQEPPKVALVLGSGLHALIKHMSRVKTLRYDQVAGWRAPSVAGHPGRLNLATWANKRLLVFEGRYHRYEGHTPAALVSAARLAAEFGVGMFLATNCSGGIASSLCPPCLVAVTDHVHWTKAFFWRQPSSPSPYSPNLLDQLRRTASELALPLTCGVYAQVIGPNYETPAEIRALRACGADLVGMSTANEIDAARQLGLECAAVSAVTNRGAGLSDKPLTHEEVLANATALEKPLAVLLERFLQNLKPAGESSSLPDGTNESIHA